MVAKIDLNLAKAIHIQRVFKLKQNEKNFSTYRLQVRAIFYMVTSVLFYSFAPYLL